MESMLMGVILAAVAIVGALWGLTVVNDRQQKRILKDLTRPRQTRTFDMGLEGEILPPEETGLAVWQPARAAPTPSYEVENKQPRHVHNLETGFLVPLATAGGTAIALTIAAGALALAFHWPAKTVLIIFALTLAGGWLWRLGIADALVWSIESWTQTDLDGDGIPGRPAHPFAVANPGQARQTAGRAAQMAAEAERRAELLRFLDVCYLTGCSEAAHGVQASGPDRSNYTACRDILLGLGLARWKNPERPKGGWVLTTDPATAKAVAEKHVLN